MKIDCSYCENSYLYGDKIICKMDSEEKVFVDDCNNYKLHEYWRNYNEGV